MSLSPEPFIRTTWQNHAESSDDDDDDDDDGDIDPREGSGDDENDDDDDLTLRKLPTTMMMLAMRILGKLPVATAATPWCPDPLGRRRWW